MLWVMPLPSFLIPFRASSILGPKGWTGRRARLADAVWRTFCILTCSICAQQNVGVLD